MYIYIHLFYIICIRNLFFSIIALGGVLPGSRKLQGNRPQKGHGTKAPTGAIYDHYIYIYIYREIEI